MSLLDIDERLLQLAEKVEFVYSPLVDAKQLPESVDVGIIEGAVSTEEDLEKAREFREHCKFLISLGDCAVTGNVPAMRNLFPLDSRAGPGLPGERARSAAACPPRACRGCCPIVRPLHAVVKVDLFVQGCPPPADAIWYVLSELIEGRVPDPTEVTRFGA